MKKVFKWFGIGLGSLVALLLLITAALAVYAEVKFKQKFSDRPLYPIQADTSPEGLARGEYLVHNVMGCADCHAGGQGQWPPAGYSQEIRMGPIYVLSSVPNLTPDVETGLGGWTDAEIARAIREGVDKDGYELESMPSANYYNLSDADVAAIVGYLRSLEPVRSPLPEMQVNLPAKILSALGLIGLPSVGEPIQSARPAPERGTPEYGAYLVSLGGCRDCHGAGLSGGAVPFAGPETPYAPNLTSNSQLSRWTEAEFLALMRTGVNPVGHTLNDVMPWRVYGQMSDEDLTAIFHYLRALPGATASR